MDSLKTRLGITRIKLPFSCLGTITIVTYRWQHTRVSLSSQPAQLSQTHQALAPRQLGWTGRIINLGMKIGHDVTSKLENECLQDTDLCPRMWSDLGEFELWIVRVHVSNLVSSGRAQNLDDFDQLIDARVTREDRLGQQKFRQHTPRTPNICHDFNHAHLITIMILVADRDRPRFYIKTKITECFFGFIFIPVQC